jgi:hypothetical protein
LVTTTTLNNGTLPASVTTLAASSTLQVGPNAPSTALSIFSGTATGARQIAAVLRNDGTTAGSTVSLNFLDGEDGTVGRTRAIIEADYDGVANNGALSFQTRSAGTVSQKMRLSYDGTLTTTGAVTPTVADSVIGIKAISTSGRYRLRSYVDATNGAVLDSTNTAENAYQPFTINGSTIRLLGDSSVLTKINGSDVTNTTSTGLAVTGALTASTTGKVGTTLGVGDATPAATGAGISFPATQSASSDANTLDDYREESYTATATGLTTSPTGTVSFVRAGNTVTMSIPTFTGTSNAATFTLTGGPTTMRPSGARNVIVRTADNGGSTTAAIATIGTDGVIQIFKDLGASSFTASGTKLIGLCCISYII